jgi:hypothetical protein
VKARGRGQEALSHSAWAVPRCKSKPASWGTAPTACRDGIAIRKAACTVSGAGGGVLASLKMGGVAKGLPLPSALLCGADGVELSPGALCVCKPGRLLWKKVDPAKRLIRDFVELDVFGTDVKTSGCSREEAMPLDEEVQNKGCGEFGFTWTSAHFTGFASLRARAFSTTASLSSGIG